MVVVPLAIYFYSRIHLIALGIALGQVIVGLGILHVCQGGFRLRWPLVAENRLVGRGFSWRNLVVFLVINVFGLLPGVTVYLGLCAALAVNHFSEGFLALRPAGLTVQVRKYVRDDGKSIQLVPMSHIGEPDYYQSLARSFPTNAIILMEGVSDDQNLITNKITYQRMATALGVAEQHEEFRPRGEMVSADVDVAEFTPNTIAGLNLVMLIHSRGMNAGTMLQLMQFSPPHFEEQLFDDLLRKRNRHLVEEIKTRFCIGRTSSCPGARRTCRRLRGKFRRPVSACTSTGNMWRSGSVLRETRGRVLRYEKNKATSPARRLSVPPADNNRGGS